MPLVIFEKETISDTEGFVTALKESEITHLTAVPTLLEALVPHFQGKECHTSRSSRVDDLRLEQSFRLTTAKPSTGIAPSGSAFHINCFWSFRRAVSQFYRSLTYEFAI